MGYNKSVVTPVKYLRKQKYLSKIPPPRKIPVKNKSDSRKTCGDKEES